MDKTCIEIRELMALSSDATPNERIAIEAHVPVCSECAVEHARLQAMLGNLALLREGTMPPGASERIWRGVQSAVPGSRRPRILGWTARAAAVLVIGLAVGYSASSVAGLKSAIRPTRSAPGRRPRRSEARKISRRPGRRPGSCTTFRP
jgi:anti-sigma factor RsiW